MKAKFAVFIALATIGITFSSCKKFYDCQCINYLGQVSTTTIKAANTVDARRTCNAQDLRGSCELK